MRFAYTTRVRVQRISSSRIRAIASGGLGGGLGCFTVVTRRLCSTSLGSVAISFCICVARIIFVFVRPQSGHFVYAVKQLADRSLFEEALLLSTLAYIELLNLSLPFQTFIQSFVSILQSVI